MMSFREYIWRRIREGLLVSWVILCGVSAVAYIVMIIFLKDRQVESNLRVATLTIHASMMAADWALTLGHLRILEENGPMFFIQLAGVNDSEMNLSGPFGEKPWGIGSVCRKLPVGEGVSLSGCMVIFGAEEILTLFLFLLLAIGLFFSVYKLVSFKMLFFIERISTDLKTMNYLKFNESQSSLNSVDEIVEIQSIRQYIFCLLQEARDISKVMTMRQLSSQVAHDIRSPLTALDVVLDDLSSLSENKRILIRNAINRIRDIANNLLQSYKDDESIDTVNGESSFIISMLDMIISEKRIQYALSRIEFNLHIDQNTHVMFAAINPIEFKRMISNLLDNSVEAITGAGVITISLSKNEANACIKVIDTGRGMTGEMLNSLPNVSSVINTKNGHGLGLTHAYSLLELWQGSIQISSKVDCGTVVTITLPLTSTPTWFNDSIRIKSGSKIIVFDDDPSIHEVWLHRLNDLSHKEIDLLHFSAINDLVEYIQKLDNLYQRILFLMDYEIIGTRNTGLDIIEQYKIAHHAILVTSRYEEGDIIYRCNQLGIKIIPKLFAPHIPIYLINSKNNADLIIIDDNRTLTDAWILRGKRISKNVVAYNKIADFESVMFDQDKNVPIYIDSDLNESQSGQVFAKELHEAGFNQLYLVTGYPASSFGVMPWITGVLGKEPPF